MRPASNLGSGQELLVEEETERAVLVQRIHGEEGEAVLLCPPKLAASSLRFAPSLGPCPGQISEFRWQKQAGLGSIVEQQQGGG